MTLGGRAIPEKPVFATESERVVWDSLRSTLAEDEVLIHGLRFSDRHAGDIEIDILLLSPQLGAAVIEVKGGVVDFNDGTWTTTNGGGTKRRIHPADQARRAKHALRKYLDRQPTWGQGLLRSQWFLAFPFTTVSGDMGPEAHREQILGKGDLPTARERIDQAMASLIREPDLPTGDWVDQVVGLLMEAPDSSLSDERFTEAAHASSRHLPPGLVLALAILASAGVAAGLALAFGAWGAVVAAVLVAITLIVMTSAGSRQWLSRRGTIATAGTGAAILAGASVLGMSHASEPSPDSIQTPRSAAIPADAPCSSAYDPCVRELPEDRDCPEIGFQVTLVGEGDPYGLDRDGNGLGCESYPTSETGEE